MTRSESFVMNVKALLMIFPSELIAFDGINMAHCGGRRVRQQRQLELR